MPAWITPTDAAKSLIGVRLSQSTGDVPTLLAQLDNLRKHGLISEEEFQVKKEELIRRM